MVGMRSLALSAVLVLGAATCALAQDGPPPGGPPGGGRGGRGGPGGMMSRWLGGSVEEVQKELGLTDEQRGKIEEIVTQTGETLRARFEAARGSGDWQSIRTEIEKVTTEAVEKVKGTLNDEQKEKFTKLVEERRNRWSDMARGGDRGGRGGSPEERVKRAMDALKIEKADEAEAVKALVEKVVKLQGDLMTHDRSACDKAGGLLKSEDMADDAIEARMKELRDARKAIDDQLLAAQDELRKVVTPRQEIELFRQSLLR